jgi:hypothetical protein
MPRRQAGASIHTYGNDATRIRATQAGFDA